MGEWFMRLGGFTRAGSTDANGMTPLMHSIASETFSRRACLSTEQLMVMTPTEMINSACRGGSCSKYTALHFACDGNDLSYGICHHKVWVVEKLLELRANINARDDRNNTPLLLAAGNGMTAVCLQLIEQAVTRTSLTIRIISLGRQLMVVHQPRRMRLRLLGAQRIGVIFENPARRVDEQAGPIRALGSNAAKRAIRDTDWR